MKRSPWLNIAPPNFEIEMKKPSPVLSFILAIILPIFTSMGAGLKGKIIPTPSEKKIYIYELRGDLSLVIDSSSLKGGKFSFIPKTQKFPRGVYRVGVSQSLYSEVILSDEDVEMEIPYRNWESAMIRNSEENRYFMTLRDLNQKVKTEMEILENKYRLLLPKAQTNRPEFEKSFQALKEKADSLLKNQSKKTIEMQATNKALYFAKLARLMSADSSLDQNTFITKADFEDPENLRADIWTNRVSSYFQRFGEGDGEKWGILSDQIIQMTQPGTPAREVAYRAVAKALLPLEQNGMNNGYEVASLYAKEFPGKVSSRFLENFTPGPPAVGEKAPEIELADRSGNPLKLSSLKGKVVLLDFWASWCGPCRHENPTVVKAYDKYKEKGFTVFSVSLDNSKDKWLAAIAKDGLTWENHVSDLKGWQSAGAALYKVSGIPATFLLDKEGKIVAKNLRGPALEEKLKELLGP
jgi:thiol-disulfide isomerase/thioredoxin